MAMTIHELAGVLRGIGLNFGHDTQRDMLVFGFQTSSYQNSNGQKTLGIVVQLLENGEYLKVFAPQAMKATGAHADALLRACMMVQWMTKLIQFEFDAADGEIRPTIEFPLEDGRVTERQMRRCVHGLVSLMDQYYPVLKRAADTGMITFPSETVGAEGVMALLQQLLSRTGAGAGNRPPESI